jgi:hypothetical protein
MKSTHTAILDIPKLSKAAKAAHIFLAMENNSLLSVGQLCDEDYYVLLSTDEVTILNATQKTLMKGSRDLTTGLWRINLCQNKPSCNMAPKEAQIHSVNNVYCLSNTGALVNCLHKAEFSCTKSALIHAVKKGHLATWPGLMEEAINKHLKLTPAAAMGHINQKRQNILSTKEKLLETEDEDIIPMGSGEKTHLVFAVVLDQGQIHTDLTGNLPTRSSKGNNRLMICYSYDANYIRPIAMKSKSCAEWVSSCGVVFDEMTSKGFKPKVQTMDNEASAALKNYFTEKEMNYQLVPPHCHRTNAAERAIRTFKEHFKAGLATVDPDFHVHLWDRLLSQAEITLNLLRASRLHPQLSSASHYHGLIDYNETAFPPPQVARSLHMKSRHKDAPGQHMGSTWATWMVSWPRHALLSVSKRVYHSNGKLAHSRHTRIIPHNSHMPQMSSTYRIIMAAQDMTDSLKHPHPNFPFATIGDDTISALATLAEIFTRKFKKPEATNGPPAMQETAANKRQNSQPQPEIMSQKNFTSKHIEPTSTRHSKTCNNLQGWSHPQQGLQHLLGCQQGLTNYLRETFPGTFWTSVALIVQLRLVKSIGQRHQ